MHISSKWLNHLPSAPNYFSDTNLPHRSQFSEKEWGQWNCYAGLPEGRLWPAYGPDWQSPFGSQRSPGRPDIPQEGNRKDAEAGYPDMPKDKISRKQTEQRALAESHNKIESL